MIAWLMISNMLSLEVLIAFVARETASASLNLRVLSYRPLPFRSKFGLKSLFLGKLAHNPRKKCPRFIFSRTKTYV